jgi:hypothetical protein
MFPRERRAHVIAFAGPRVARPAIAMATTDSSRWSGRTDSARPPPSFRDSCVPLGFPLGCTLTPLAVAKFLGENRCAMSANDWRLTCRSI